MKRVFLIILDSFGIGFAPDADLFGDVGANTLKSISASKHLKIPNLNLRLPIGISFYTFQTMSYSIDVYRGNVKAEIFAGK